MNALIIDLDGVLRLWDPALMEDAESAAGLPCGAIAEAAFLDDTLLQLTITGAITDDEWRTRIAASLNRSHGSGGELAVRRWSQSPGEVDLSVLDIVQAERKRRPVVLLTNATTRLNADLTRLGLADAFDAVVNSSSIGAAKPAAAAFSAAANAAGCVLQHCLFVDDTVANVAAAQQLGMQALLYRDVDALRDWLSEHA